jgi:EmrB/QacA subfamily drug resistance transporter
VRAEANDLRYHSASGRWVLLATVLGSGVAALDATVVNVALPAIGEDLGGGVAGLQWILNSYLLTLASLILLGGSLGDRFGRRRVFVIGLVWFGAASALCGLAPNVAVLVAARALQGVGGALLTPGSLAIIEASFRPEDRARAIGAWSGLAGVATAIGPFAGGWLVGAVSWRMIFLLNLPLIAVTTAVAVRHVPETSDPLTARGIDVKGALLGAAGLAGITYALIEGPSKGFTSAPIVIAALIGVGGIVGFFLAEARGRHPMLPLDIFASRLFATSNGVTFLLYAALGATFFLFVVHLQEVLGYSPLEAGSALFPVTLLMLLLSPRAGNLAQRIGPRIPMSVGPALVAVGLLLMSGIDATSTYATDVLPAVLVFGLGLAATVAPLTATVLAAAEPRHAGVASGVNNAVARVGGLLAIAVLPLVAGLSHDDFGDAAAFADGFMTAMRLAAGLALAGGLLAWFTIRRDEPMSERLPSEYHCAAGGPPLRPAHH